MPEGKELGPPVPRSQASAAWIGGPSRRAAQEAGEGTLVKLQIGNDSTDIETPLTPKRQCVALSSPGVPMSFPWDESEMKQRLIAASAYLRDYPLGVMSQPQFIDALLQVESTRYSGDRSKEALCLIQKLERDTAFFFRFGGGLGGGAFFFRFGAAALA